MRQIDADALKAQIEKENCKVCRNRNHDSHCLGCMVDVAITYLDEAQTVGGWINVKDRLPEKEGRYLVLTSGIFGIKIAMFTMSLKRHFDYMFEDGEPDRPGFYDWDSEDDWIEDGVTHWMPLPKGPKEEE